MPTLTDGVVLLNGPRLADVAAMVAGEDEEQARRFGWWPARSTEQHGRTAVERWRHQWRADGSTRAFAVREARNGAFVGGCEIRLGEAGVAEMSYWVVAAFRRRGYATRAARLASEYAFDELGVGLLELHIAADNTGSRGVARGAGFSHDPTGRPRVGDLSEEDVLYSRRAPPPGPKPVARTARDPGRPPAHR